jgi:uncharacterized membrane protein (UPF0136 family)
MIKAAAVVELAVAVGIITFWISFFSADLVTIKDPHLKEIYLAFESAFPVPDICLSLVLLIGGLGLLKKKPHGSLFSLVGGASLVFLSLLDVSFNSRHGIYFLGLGEAVLNASINIICLASGLLIISVVWKHQLKART